MHHIPDVTQKQQTLPHIPLHACTCLFTQVEHQPLWLICATQLGGPCRGPLVRPQACARVDGVCQGSLKVHKTSMGMTYCVGGRTGCVGWEDRVCVYMDSICLCTCVIIHNDSYTDYMHSNHIRIYTAQHAHSYTYAQQSYHKHYVAADQPQAGTHVGRAEH